MKEGPGILGWQFLFWRLNSSQVAAHPGIEKFKTWMLKVLENKKLCLERVLVV